MQLFDRTADELAARDTDLAIIPITLCLAFIRTRKEEKADQASGQSVSFKNIFPFFILYFIGDFARGMIYFLSIYAIFGDYCIISYVSFNSYDSISRIYAGGSYHPCLSKVNAL